MLRNVHTKFEQYFKLKNEYSRSFEVNRSCLCDVPLPLRDPQKTQMLHFHPYGSGIPDTYFIRHKLALILLSKEEKA